MHELGFSSLLKRSSFLLLPLLPLASAVWAAGCSDDPAQPDPTPDAGQPETALPDTAAPPPIDAGVDTGPPKRDCAADEDADGLFKHLDCTGLYSDFASKTIAADNKPYKPGVEFWSDGATKSRFLHLPPGAKIDISDFDDWTFPNGTKAWKEFVVDGKRVETRLYWKNKDAWLHTTYRWNADETEAVRNDSGETIARAGKAPYEVPGTSQCDQCHYGRKEPLLGVEPVSLGISTATGVTVATLAAEGRFATPPPVTSLTIPDDANQKARPALGWLHANCGHCHNGISGAAKFTNLWLLMKASQLIPDGGTPTVEGLDAYTTAVNVPANRPGGGVRIVPTDPTTSLVSVLSGRRVPEGMDPDATQMPPTVTRVVDTAGHQLLDDWITVIP